MQQEKADLIESILVNSCYQPDSGLIQRLKKSLMKMAFCDLMNLDLVIRIKQSDYRDAK